MRKNTLVQAKAVEQYDKSALVSNKDYPSLELVRLERIFLKNQKGKLLEYGFGSGCNTLHLLKKNYDITALDISKNAIKKFKKKIRKKKKIKLVHLKANSTKLPFKNNTFNFVIAMSVLSLLGSRKTIIKLFKEFDRVLKKNGKLILDINTKKSNVSNKKKEKIKRSFTYVVDDYIETYCVGSKKQFTQLVKPFFNIIDVGFSRHQLFKKEISEFIICCEKKNS